MNEPLDASSQTKPRLAHHLALRKGKILDVERITYLKAYISAPCEAVNAGAGVRGCFVWTLLDNFELGAGYANRFGLVYVNYPTQRRIPKASAHWYGRLIHAEEMRAAP